MSAVFEQEDDMRLACPAGRWPFDAAEWQTWLSEPGLRAYFVTTDAGDAGHFALRARGDVRHLSWVLLRREWRGGYGRAFVALAEREAMALGAAQMTLNALRNNPRALHLYSACGFTPVSEADGKVTMIKDLVAPVC